ncbi:MAG TPA: hypothetical protein VLA70_11590 [Nocardioides sp.]|nr:hypothetical protein [Nocardioides sp.]
MRILAIATAGACLLAATLPTVTTAAAHPTETALSGAIFTTDASGNPVNLNIYDAKEDVYLNGGPGINAPDDAAGLPAGTYSFQVTDPNGGTLLSTDNVACRQFSVDASGVITSVAPSVPCAHATDTSTEDGGLTVQLFPFNDTPNNGGVYKVWVTPTEMLDCDAPGNKNCFVPHHSKTDNFKVREGAIVEIDARFSRHGTPGFIDGLMATKFDTVGAHNNKYSEYDPAVLAFHEAHFEAVEPGDHQVVVSDQDDCTIIDAHGPDGTTYLPVNGTVTVPVTVAKNVRKDRTYFVDVHCA